VYSPEVKDQLNLTQGDINLVGSVMNLGGYISIVAGFVYDHYGPSATMLIAAGLTASGYATMWAMVSQTISYDRALLCLFTFLWSQGNSWADTVAVATNVRNFSHNKGMVLGLIKSTFGLSAGVLTIVYNSYFPGNVNALLRFLAVMVPCVLLAMSTLYRVVKPEQVVPMTAHDKSKLWFGFCTAGAIAVYVTTVSALFNWNKITNLLPFGVVLPVVVLPLALQGAPSRLFAWMPCGRDASAKQHLLGLEAGHPAAVPLLVEVGADGSRHTVVVQEAPGGPSVSMLSAPGASTGVIVVESPAALAAAAAASNTGGGYDSPPRSAAHYSVLASVAAGGAAEGSNGDLSLSLNRVSLFSPTSAYSASHSASRLPRREATTRAIAAANEKPVSGAALFEALLSLDFWLLMYLLFAGTGAGLVMINSLGGLALSLGAVEGGQDLDVTLLSVFNCAGRMFFGLISDFTAQRVSRATWLVVGLASMTGAMLLTAFSSLNMLYVAALWTGFSYGSFWALGPSIFADRFGGRAFASIYAVSNLSSAAGSFILYAQLATSIYNSHIAPGGGTKCYGPDCYRLTFIILALMCALATLAAAWLSWRLRPLFVGENGRAIDYSAYEAATGHGCLVRLAQRVCLPLCRCRVGRAMCSSREGHDALHDEHDGPHGHGYDGHGHDAEHDGHGHDGHDDDDLSKVATRLNLSAEAPPAGPADYHDDRDDHDHAGGSLLLNHGGTVSGGGGSTSTAAGGSGGSSAGAAPGSAGGAAGGSMRHGAGSFSGPVSAAGLQIPGVRLIAAAAASTVGALGGGIDRSSSSASASQGLALPAWKPSSLRAAVDDSQWRAPPQPASRPLSPGVGSDFPASGASAGTALSPSRASSPPQASAGAPGAVNAGSAGAPPMPRWPPRGTSGVGMSLTRPASGSGALSPTRALSGSSLGAGASGRPSRSSSGSDAAAPSPRFGAAVGSLPRGLSSSSGMRIRLDGGSAAASATSGSGAAGVAGGAASPGHASVALRLTVAASAAAAELSTSPARVGSLAAMQAALGAGSSDTPGVAAAPANGGTSATATVATRRRESSQPQHPMAKAKAAGLRRQQMQSATKGAGATPAPSAAFAPSGFATAGAGVQMMGSGLGAAAGGVAVSTGPLDGDAAYYR
jgi:MFS family permease